MAGLSAAWRLSEPGWRDRFEAITVYQRGWRLGGKGASSRGRHGRIEEHGLHVWLGSYENAFALLRECYVELDRATTDPAAPVQTWDQALIPSHNVAMADRFGHDWLIWPGHFSRNDEVPGEPESTGRELTVVDFLRRTVTLILDVADSLSQPTDDADLVLSTSPSPDIPRWVTAVRRGVSAAAMLVGDPLSDKAIRAGLLGRPLEALREAIDYDPPPERRRCWLLLSLLTATVRGLIADNLITDPRGFRAINDEDYGAWIVRHGAHPDVVDFALVRGLYDMVFGYQDGDYERPAVAAGLAVLLSGIVFFQYKGALFWKMTAGMGDVVIAPLYQALRRRGVEFEFFHRVDALHLDHRRQVVDSIEMGRQVRLIGGLSHYEPLTTVRGLPVFPDSPLEDQIEASAGTRDLESHFGRRDDVETRMLRKGEDFEHVVLAVSVGMVELVATELIDDCPEWRDMTTHLSTVATQSFQLWLKPDECTLGWSRPGVTTSGYVAPFDTWASMPQTLWAEDWPEDDSPRTVAYFCGALGDDVPGAQDTADYIARCRRQVHDAAMQYLDRHVGLFLPGAVTDRGFAWHLLSGVNGHRGSAALATQHLSVNIDPSDRYVQSVPGSDKFRLRSDESGYDNLVLAGDWTDSGLNAGCIEAAVMSGLQAANALLGRARFHRIRGFYMP
ncbi:FAD-dependent oxidoreductase [Mycobacterium sp. IDR2000157661]|uniref:FAD-dependent oxidoreductase n=1 Tax=Mycobacterium sp. IDR2000157661 TaxID=2867005 RepID=UPI001EECF004|nr:FAD-dependent oxidoreductase [Mycobacterium sp. IDR2000157661]ULE33795.1 FAD-dependent oxidoreductase [Mycobacterium sp. IDR2000157661]